jgi:hypothetical protein
MHLKCSVTLTNARWISLSLPQPPSLPFPGKNPNASSKLLNPLLLQHRIDTTEKRIVRAAGNASVEGDCCAVNAVVQLLKRGSFLKLALQSSLMILLNREAGAAPTAYEQRLMGELTILMKQKCLQNVSKLCNIICEAPHGGGNFLRRMLRGTRNHNDAAETIRRLLKLIPEMHQTKILLFSQVKSKCTAPTAAATSNRKKAIKRCTGVTMKEAIASYYTIDISEDHQASESDERFAGLQIIYVPFFFSRSLTWQRF